MADFIVTKAFLERTGFCDNVINEFVESFGEDGQINLAQEDTREMFEIWIEESPSSQQAADERWLDIFTDFRASAAAIAEFGAPEEFETDEWMLQNPLNGEVEIYHSIEECRVRRLEIIKQYLDTTDMVAVSKKWINEEGHEVIRPISNEDFLGLNRNVVETEETSE